MSATKIISNTDKFMNLFTCYGRNKNKVIKICCKVESELSELTDDDMYTYTGIRGVEFPVKEGSYTDVRENHALWSVVNDGCCKETQGYFYMEGFSNMLVDGAGHAVCTPVNMLCEWRKPASGIPQGAGTAYGIITHEDIIR